MQRSVLLFVWALSCALTVTLPAWADTTEIEASDPAGENILDAADLIEKLFDDPAVAEEIREQLHDGDYFYDPDLDGYAETERLVLGVLKVTASQWTTLHQDRVRRCGKALVPGEGYLPDDPATFAELVRLARTLFHERVHARQSNEEMTASTAKKEVPAWSETLVAMNVWIGRMEAKTAAIKDQCKLLRHLMRLRALVLETASLTADYQEKRWCPMKPTMASFRKKLNQKARALQVQIDELRQVGMLCPSPFRGVVVDCDDTATACYPVNEDDLPDEPAVLSLSPKAELLSVQPEDANACYEEVVAWGDWAATVMDRPVFIAVLANDEGVDQVDAISSPIFGSVWVWGGWVLYRPLQGFAGVDQFFYTATDGETRTTHEVIVDVRGEEVLTESSVELEQTELSIESTG